MTTSQEKCFDFVDRLPDIPTVNKDGKYVFLWLAPRFLKLFSVTGRVRGNRLRPG